MKKSIQVAVVFAALLLFPAVLYAGEQNGIIAEVQDEIITKFDFDRAYQTIRPMMTPSPEIGEEGIKKEVLDSMVDDLLLLKEAEKKGIQLTDAEISAALEQYLAQGGLSMNDPNIGFYRKKIKHNILRYRLIEEEVSSKISVSEEELKQEFAKNFSIQVKIKQIFVKDRALADYISDSLAKGADFNALCLAYSEGFNKENGGELDFMSRGKFDASFEKVMFSMKPGDTSGIIEMPQGYYIISVLDTRTASEAEYATLRESLYETVFSAKSESRYRDYISRLRQSIFIKVRYDRL